MTQDPSRAHSPQARDTREAVSVVSAYGAFRLLLLLLAGWSAFAGFALITGFAALSYEGGTASKVAGSYMMVLAPIYALIAVRRDEYRLLLWVPYAGLLAVIVPGLWQLVFDQDVDAPLILVVSLVFLALLVYMWVSSHPLDFFEVGGDADEDDDDLDDGEDIDEEEDAGDEDDEDPPEDESSAGAPASGPTRGRRYRRTP